jgi:capsular polysaccharide biosynthesis protein
LDAEPRTVDLVQYARIIRRRWLVVVTLVVLGAAFGLAYGKLAGRSYTATSQVLVAPVTQGPLNVPAQVSLLVNMSTEQGVAQSAPVVQQAAKLMHTSPTQLQAQAAKRLSIAVPLNSDLLQITWKARNPAGAHTGANAFANAYLQYRHSYLAGQIANLNSVLAAQVSKLHRSVANTSATLAGTTVGSAAHQNASTKLNQLDAQLSTANKELSSLPTYNDSGGRVIPSSLPLQPAGLSRSVVVAIGLVLGLLIGIIAAFVRDAFDDRIRDRAQLERKLGAPTLAVLSSPSPARSRSGGPMSDSGRQRGDLAILASPASPAAEAVRALRSTLVAVAERSNLRTLLLLAADSSVQSDRLMAELGLALAESGRKVILVDADLRGSLLPQLFNMSNNVGLSDVLVDGMAPDVLIRHPRRVGGGELPARITEQLAVLPSGGAIQEAFSLLDSHEMASLMQDLREAHEFILLDSPPVTEAADAFALAIEVEGVVVFCSEGKAMGRDVDEISRRLQQVGVAPIGGVLISKRAERYKHGQTPVRHPLNHDKPVAAAALRGPNGVDGAARRDRAPSPVSNNQHPRQAGEDLAKRVP